MHPPDASRKHKVADVLEPQSQRPHSEQRVPNLDQTTGGGRMTVFAISFAIVPRETPIGPNLNARL